MQDLNNIKTVEHLKIGATYTENNNTYYLFTCLSIDKTVRNGGFNDYYQTALFSVKTATGRQLLNDTKSFNYE